ncbi:MAG: ABC-F family ATP-binding cassette domain-containing protein [bacterium]
MATLLQADNIIKKYGFQEVLSGASFSIAERQKVGVIGRNGAGKSTLLKILVGEEQADDGAVSRHAELRLGYLKQNEELDLTKTALQYLIETSAKPVWHCAKIASRFGLTPELLNQKLGELSSGFRMRVKLTAMLTLEPNLILLDEPTNFLDLTTQLLMEDFLRDFSGAFLMVSHDRQLLKNTCEQTLEVEKGRCRLYPGNIEQYLAWKEEQVEVVKNINRKVEAEQKHLQAFVDRFKYKASKASQAQSKMKQIARLKTIEIEHPMKSMRIRIPVDKMKKGIAVRLDELVVGYPGKIVAGPTTFDIDRGKHMAILGDNGQGKTTFMRTLSGDLKACSGEYSWGAGLRLAYYGQATLEAMSPSDSVRIYLRRQAGAGILEEEILRMAGNFLFKDDDLDKPVKVLSGGERARLCLAGMLLSKASVFLLDEPTNHLDFESVEALGNALSEYPGTILFVSHNRTFVNLVATQIVIVESGQVVKYSGTYEEYVEDLALKLVRELPKRREERVVIKISEEPEPEDAAVKLRVQIETESKKIKANEKARAKLELERDAILTEMAMAPANFSKTLNIRLHEVKDRISVMEDEWLDLMRNLDWLKDGAR